MVKQNMSKFQINIRKDLINVLLKNGTQVSKLIFEENQKQCEELRKKLSRCLAKELVEQELKKQNITLINANDLSINKMVDYFKNGYNLKHYITDNRLYIMLNFMFREDHALSLVLYRDFKHSVDAIKYVDILNKLSNTSILEDN